MPTPPYKFRTMADRAELDVLCQILFGTSAAECFRAFRCVSCRESIPNPIADDGTLTAVRQAGLTEATLRIQLNNLADWCIDLMCVNCRTNGLARLAEMRERERTPTPTHPSVTAQGTPN